MSSVSVIATTALLLTVPVEGFTPRSYRSIVGGATVASSSSSSSPSAICLTPDDQGGRTLVAHSQRYLEQLAKESAARGEMLSSRRASVPSRRHKGRTGIIAAAKKFLTPQDGSSHANDSPDDEVLYPIVGSNLVDGSAVPMGGQHAVCSIQSTQRHESGGEEECYGYWAPPSKGGMWI